MNTKHKLTKLLALIFFCSFAFDFKGEQAGTVVQFLFAGISLMAGGMLVVLVNWRQVPKSLVLLIISWSALVGIGLGSAIFYHNSVGQYLRVSFPYILFGLSFVTIAACISNEVHISYFINMSFWLAISSSVWLAYYNFGVSDLELSSARYQFISPALPYIIAVGIASIVTARGFRLTELVAIGGSIVSVLLSETRGFVGMYLTSISLVLFLYLSTKYRDRQSQDEKSNLYTKLMVSAVIVGSGIVIAVVLRPNVVQGWKDRLFWYQSTESGYDPTYLTRVAEVQGMIQVMGKEALVWTTGMGFGANYYWSENYHDMLKAYVGDAYFGADLWDGGHNVWMYMLFSTGIVGSMLALLCIGIIIKCIWRMIIVFRNNIQLRIPDYAIVPIIATGNYFSASFTGNIFGSRLGAVYLAMGIGMIIWALDIQMYLVRGERRYD